MTNYINYMTNYTVMPKNLMEIILGCFISFSLWGCNRIETNIHERGALMDQQETVLLGGDQQVRQGTDAAALDILKEALRTELDLVQKIGDIIPNLIELVYPIGFLSKIPCNSYTVAGMRAGVVMLSTLAAMGMVEFVTYTSHMIFPPPFSEQFTLSSTTIEELQGLRNNISAHGYGNHGTIRYTRSFFFLNAAAEEERKKARLNQIREQARLDQEKEQTRLDQEKEQTRLDQEREQARLDQIREQARLNQIKAQTEAWVIAQEQVISRLLQEFDHNMCSQWYSQGVLKSSLAMGATLAIALPLTSKLYDKWERLWTTSTQQKQFNKESNSILEKIRKDTIDAFVQAIDLPSEQNVYHARACLKKLLLRIKNLTAYIKGSNTGYANMHNIAKRLNELLSDAKYKLFSANTEEGPSAFVPNSTSTSGSEIAKPFYADTEVTSLLLSDLEAKVETGETGEAFCSNTASHVKFLKYIIQSIEKVLGDLQHNRKKSAFCIHSADVDTV